MNATLVNLVDWDDLERTLKPLIDGGTEGGTLPSLGNSSILGFRGQARVIIPTQSSCYECSLDMLAKRTVYPVCTIATTPRLPEHCIEWASVLEWPRMFPGTVIQYEQFSFQQILSLITTILNTFSGCLKPLRPAPESLKLQASRTLSLRASSKTSSQQ